MLSMVTTNVDHQTNDHYTRKENINTVDIRLINEKIAAESAFIDVLTKEMEKVIVGQKHMIERLLIGLLGNGHILLEGVPGLAKTLAINTLSKAVDGDFSRIQFTPIGETTFKLDEPFLVMATQNPVEQEGTYPLPEAQVDRFMLKTIIEYPSLEDEREIMRQNMAAHYEDIKPVVNLQQILRAREVVREVYMDEKIEKYILDIVFATRFPEKYGLPELKGLISFGASPRGSINLGVAAKCYAFIKRRGYVVPEDVRAVIMDVLRHRIGITYEAEAENMTSEDIIEKIVNTVEVP